MFSDEGGNTHSGLNRLGHPVGKKQKIKVQRLYTFKFDFDSLASPRPHGCARCTDSLAKAKNKGVNGLHLLLLTYLAISET